MQSNLDDEAEMVSMKGSEVLEFWIPEVYFSLFVVMVNLNQISYSFTSGHNESSA